MSLLGRSPTRLLLGLVGVLLLLGGCQRSAPPSPASTLTVPDSLQLAWQPIDSLNARLPDGVRAYAARDTTLPLRAWYVRIRESDPVIQTQVAVSADSVDRRERMTTFARRLDACVAINGGYFTMGRTPADHVGLLLDDERLLFAAPDTLLRDSIAYPLARAAMGFLEEAVQFAWATTAGDTLLAWSAPPGNRPQQPGTWADTPQRWPVREALGAGPMLLRDGHLRVTADAEVFFGTSIPATHPRTAAGRTAEGDLILMVVDGRQPASRGVDLEELAYLMAQVGAVDAMNLDGGGSSTLVVRGVRLNRPGGGDAEREVLSALVTTCE